MSSFGDVPMASVWPCARCVEAITSPSSRARQTPTATASWPIATWRKPGSSPARNRSSTFSSKRRIRSISRKKSRSVSSDSAPRCSTLAICGQRTDNLPRVRLGERWREIERGLPDDWTDARLLLRVADPAEAERAAAKLTPLMPGRNGSEIRFYTARRGAGASPDAVRRSLRGLDREGIRGELELVSTAQPEPGVLAVDRATLAEAWDVGLATLPPDWSDLYAEIELTAPDHLERAALLLAPVNPARVPRRSAFRFRVAHSFGYGASSQMTARCFKRLDQEGIPGRLTILHVLSDTHNADTQGPVWRVGGRAV